MEQARFLGPRALEHDAVEHGAVGRQPPTAAAGPGPVGRAGVTSPSTRLWSRWQHRRPRSGLATPCGRPRRAGSTRRPRSASGRPSPRRRRPHVGGAVVGGSDGCAPAGALHGGHVAAADRVGPLVAVVVAVDDEVHPACRTAAPTPAHAAVGAVDDVGAVGAVVEPDDDPVDGSARSAARVRQPRGLGAARPAPVAGDLVGDVVGVEVDEGHVAVAGRPGGRDPLRPVPGRGTRAR